MRILITEKQISLLLEEIKNIPEEIKNTPEEIADSLWEAVSGTGTDEDLFLSSLSQIKDKRMFETVSNLLKTNYNQDFYSIVNESFEFTLDEKKKIVATLTTNKIPHVIIKGEKIAPAEGLEKPKDLNFYLKNNLKFRQNVVAATLMGEAKGEKEKGMMAVLSVLYNRTKKMPSKGSTMAEQALFKKQFSMWNMIPRTLESINKEIERQKSSSPDMWKKAITLASNPVKDITKGATHYFASTGPNALSSKEKRKHSWTKELERPIKIGNHLFGTPTP
jgi:hypothetical protein